MPARNTTMTRQKELPARSCQTPRWRSEASREGTHQTGALQNRSAPPAAKGASPPGAVVGQGQPGKSGDDPDQVVDPRDRVTPGVRSRRTRAPRAWARIFGADQCQDQAADGHDEQHRPRHRPAGAMGDAVECGGQVLVAHVEQIAGSFGQKTALVQKNDDDAGERKYVDQFTRGEGRRAGRGHRGSTARQQEVGDEEQRGQLYCGSDAGGEAERDPSPPDPALREKVPQHQRVTTRFTCPNPTVMRTGLSINTGRLRARAHRHTAARRSRGAPSNETTRMPSSMPRLHSVHAVCTVATDPKRCCHGAKSRAAKGG